MLSCGTAATHYYVRVNCTDHCFTTTLICSISYMQENGGICFLLSLRSKFGGIQWLCAEYITVVCGDHLKQGY